MSEELECTVCHHPAGIHDNDGCQQIIGGLWPSYDYCKCDRNERHVKELARVTAERDKTQDVLTIKTLENIKGYSVLEDVIKERDTLKSENEALKSEVASMRTFQCEYAGAFTKMRAERDALQLKVTKFGDVICDLSDYRRRNTFNFKLEKFDDFITRLKLVMAGK